MHISAPVFSPAPVRLTGSAPAPLGRARVLFGEEENAESSPKVRPLTLEGLSVQAVEEIQYRAKDMRNRNHPVLATCLDNLAECQTVEVALLSPEDRLLLAVWLEQVVTGLRIPGEQKDLAGAKQIDAKQIGEATLQILEDLPELEYSYENDQAAKLKAELHDTLLNMYFSEGNYPKALAHLTVMLQDEFKKKPSPSVLRTLRAMITVHEAADEGEKVKPIRQIFETLATLTGIRPKWLSKP